MIEAENVEDSSKTITPWSFLPVQPLLYRHHVNRLCWARDAVKYTANVTIRVQGLANANFRLYISSQTVPIQDLFAPQCPHGQRAFGGWWCYLIIQSSLPYSTYWPKKAWAPTVEKDPDFMKIVLYLRAVKRWVGSIVVVLQDLRVYDKAVKQLHFNFLWARRRLLKVSFFSISRTPNSMHRP